MKSITYSAIRSFLNCRKKFYYQYIRQLKPIDMPVYFDIGSAIHIALETWYKSDDIKAAQREIDTYFNNKMPLSMDENYEEIIQKIYDNCTISMRIFNRYVNNYQVEIFKVLEVEKEFTLNAKDIGINIDAEIKLKVDAIIEKNGVAYLMEHKTTASIDEFYKKKLSVDLQSMFYVICLKSLGYNVQGVCYNVISKKLPAKPEVLKNGKLSTAKTRKPDLIEYLKAINENGLNQADYEDYLEWLKENQSESFFREYITYHDLQLDALKIELESVIFDIQKSYTEGENPFANYFYKNTSNCIGFGTCQFFDICVALYPESIIENLFIEKSAIHEEYEAPGA